MNSDSVNVTVCYSESKGYISYIFKNNIKLSELELTLTGSGNQMNCHVLLPKAITKVVSVSSNNQPVDFKISKIENSSYVDFDVSLPNVKTVKIKY